MDKYQLLSISFYVCLGVAILLFILCIILFFALDIRSAFATLAAEKRKKSGEEDISGDQPTVLLQAADAPRVQGKFSVIKKEIYSDTEEIIE